MKMKKLISIIATLAIICTLVPNIVVSAAEATFTLTNFSADKVNGGDTYDLVDADGNVGLTVKILGDGAVANTKDSGTTIDGVAYGKPGLSPATRPSESGGAWASGFGFEFTPEYSGTVRVVYKLGNGKTMDFNNVTDPSKSVEHKNETGANENYVDFVVLADNTYRVYVCGTGNEYWGFAFTANTSAEPSISIAEDSAEARVGETVTLTAITSNIGDAAVVWSSDNEAVATVADGVVTSVAPGTANITATVTVGGVDYSATCALTVQDVATVTYDISAYACEGTAPEAVTVTKGESVTIPVNNSVYGADSTLTGWTDGSDLYAIGESFTLTEDVTLTPWFEDNKAALGDAETSVTFYFGESNGAQTIAVQGTGNPSAILVEQAVIGDAKIDVKADIDASAGKFNNFKRGDKWAQVNGGTIINVPVLAGSVITMGDIYNDAGTYTIGGVECTGDGGTYTATEDGTVAIVAGAESGSYWESITVTYPKKVEKTMPTVAVAEFGTYTENTGNPAKAYTGTFTVDEAINNPVNCVEWTVGDATAMTFFGTTISSGTVVTGLVVVAADLDAIPAPTAEALFAE